MSEWKQIMELESSVMYSNIKMYAGFGGESVLINKYDYDKRHNVPYENEILLTREQFLLIGREMGWV